MVSGDWGLGNSLYSLNYEFRNGTVQLLECSHRLLLRLLDLHKALRF